MNTRSQAIAVVLLLCGAAIASADDAACQKAETDGLAAGLKASMVIVPQPLCYGAQDENHSLSKEIRALVDKTPTQENLSLALKKLASRVQVDELYGDQTGRDKYALQARSAAAAVEQGVGAGNGAAAVTVWQVTGGRAPALPEIDVIQILDESCPANANTTTGPCLTALNSAKAWLRVFQLTERTLTQYAAPALNALLERSTTRLAMWHSYRDDALPQFQWEWLLNSWRLNKEDKGPNGRPRDQDGQPMGPMEVPTDQIIFLHPGVGLEYRDRPDSSTAGDESKTAPIVYLEILGRNRWSWNEKTGEMIGGSGVSLVATYADRDDDTEVGYGLLFHSRRSKAYTLGITRSGDATNIIFNADLAEFFKEKMGYWKGVGEMATQ